MNTVRPKTALRHWLATLGTLALANCKLFSPQTPQLRVDMAVTSFTRVPPDSKATIAYRITSHGVAPAYVAACDGHPAAGVDRLTAAGWEAYEGSYCQANVDMTPLALAPGQAIGALWSWDIGGTYRFHVYYGEAAADPWNRGVLGPTFVLR